MKLGILIVFCGLFGLAIGSFLNVVIYRVPKGLSVVSPRSACPSCETPIAERDNMPVRLLAPLTGSVPALPRADLCSGTPWSNSPVPRSVRRAGRAVRLRLGAPGLPGPVRGTARPLRHRRRDACCLPKVIVWPLSIAVAALFVLAAAITGEWHPLLVGAICGAAWFVALLRHESGAALACSASGTSGSPPCWAWHSAGWAGATSLLGSSPPTSSVRSSASP